MNARLRLFSAMLVAASLAGCARDGELVVNQGVGVSAVRSACPAVGIPDYTGNVTVFSSPTSRTVSDVDLTATITNVRSTCDESGDRIYSQANFDVLARRTDTNGARSVELPYFSTVLRGGSAIVTKQVGTVMINFADGEARAQASASAGAFVNKAEATLSDEIKAQINRRRKPGDPDAALDPLADPAVRAAIARASFELLVGFQLTEDQLAYNATR